MPGLELAILLLPFVLIGLGYYIGTATEHRHLRLLDAQEAGLSDIRMTDVKRIPAPESVASASFVMGTAVIATDYFKTFASALRNVVGGEVRTLESLVRRARRQAIVRMLEEARAMGACEVHNVRLETSNVLTARGRARAISAEVFAYGTAVVRQP